MEPNFESTLKPSVTTPSPQSLITMPPSLLKQPHSSYAYIHLCIYILYNIYIYTPINLSLDSHHNVMNLLYKRPLFTCSSVLYLTKTFVVETSYHCNSFVSVLLECALSLLMAPPPPCAESPPPLAVRVTPRYVVLDTSADLVLEARFRGSFYSHDWLYHVNDPTFLTSVTSLFTPATVTNVGQTYTIPAGSASLRVGYYGPRVLPTLTGTPIRPTPENTVIVGSFGKCTTTDSVVPQVMTLPGTHL